MHKFCIWCPKHSGMFASKKYNTFYNRHNTYMFGFANNDKRIEDIKHIM